MFRFKKPHINHVVMTMIYADFLLISATGLLAPIYAVFLTTQIEGGSLTTVGFATTLFWVVKSLVQVPISISADAHEGERDDFMFMMYGGVIMGFVPLLYYFFATEVWHIYAIQIVNGIGYGMMTPTWLAVFTRHIDKHKECREWTLHSNMVGLGFATAAAFGGVLAERFGFRIIFLLVSAGIFLGVIALARIRKDLDGDKGIEHFRRKIELSHQQDAVKR